jgi:hypothetical protein
MGREHIIGLDLGQTTDFSALAVLERRAEDTASPALEGPCYAVRHLARFPLGTPYPTIVTVVARLARTPGLACAALVVDQTGVGRPVVDHFRHASLPAPLVPITITGGSTVKRAAGGSLHVPKKQLVTALQEVLQAGRLQVARRLPLAGVLVQELLNFRVQLTEAANETFGAACALEQDDTVLAVTLACWYATLPPGRAKAGSRSDGGDRASRGPWV